MLGNTPSLLLRVQPKIPMPTTDLHSPIFAQFDRLSGLNELVMRAKTYGSLESLITQVLPEQLRAHARFASLDGQHLRFLADSSAWATKLRLLSTVLIDRAHALGHSHVTTLKVGVRRVG
jgi:hypothetical protein